MLPNLKTMWAVIRPVQAVTEDIFIRTVRPRRSVNCFLTAPNRNILTYLLTYLYQSNSSLMCRWRFVSRFIASFDADSDRLWVSELELAATKNDTN